MNLSTVAQPCNATDYFSQGSEFGMVSFDWSNAKQVWSKNPNTLTNCSEMLVEQAKRVKTTSPSTKVFVYRNFELALEWIRGQRQHMLDPTKAGFFLQYQTGPKKGLVIRRTHVYTHLDTHWHAPVHLYIIHAYT
jgi:hypothetical protein